jgi:propanol-preferring alcohol dehydrogenase
MKAWQFTMTNEPLVLNEVPEPTPGPGEVVLDIKAAGLCHSDVGAMTDPGWLAIIPNRPITIGHEIAGVVSALGEGVTDVKIGDRVGVCPTASELAPGYGRDGGFTYKHRVLAGDLVPMPDALSFELAALGTDAGMTAYQAMVVRGGLKPGMKVGVIGLGGLGQIGARVAVVKGAEVHVAELNKAVWPLAKELGVTSVVADVSEWAGQGFDLIVDYAGFGTTTAGALKAIRFDGRVVQVGMGRLETTIDIRDLILNKAQLLGSVGGTKEDVAAVYELIGSGDLKPVVTVITFDEIPDSLEKLHQGKVIGRLVAHIAD